MIRLGVAAIGLAADGIEDWTTARSMFREQTAYQPELGLPLQALQILPANERRRTTKLIKLALQSAQDARMGDSVDNSKLATVFSSSDGDLDVVDKIITALGLEGSPVSPTHFHNSVHNAPSGYWSIATKSHAPSTSLSAYDDSFAVGLLEAATQIISDQQDVLLVTYDMPPPPLLKPYRPLHSAFATALCLTSANSEKLHSIIEIDLLENGDSLSKMCDPELEKLRLGNSAARGLPLLECFAKEIEEEVIIPYLFDAAIKIRVIPC